MKSKVVVVKGENEQEMVTKALDLMGGVCNIIPEGKMIVLKPNAGHLGGKDTAVNTSPEFVRAVIREVKKTNPSKIIIAESSAIGCKTLECLESSGIKKVADEEGITDIIDIKSYKKLIKKEVADPTCSIKSVELPDFLLDDAYFFINLPIFKSHTSMVFSCALKNLKGVVQDKHHMVMHTTNLAGAVADLGSTIEPDLTIVDMIDPMEGYGPHAGTPAHVGCVLAGFDMVALDATACRIGGLDIDKVGYFEAVKNRGLGNFAKEDIEIIGNPISEVATKLFMPYLEGFGAFPEYNVHVGMACSTCQGVTSFNLARLKSLDCYEKCAGAQIIVGSFKGGKLPETLDLTKPVHLMGNCACSMSKKIEEAGGKVIKTPGCPPLEPLLSWNIIGGKEFQPSGLNNYDKEKSIVKRGIFQVQYLLMGLKVRVRMEKETKLFMEWLHKQKRNSY